MAETINETEIIERLNSAPSVRGFFIVAAELIEQSIFLLTQRIFRNEYLAVKSVVDPLLESSGPLGELSVRIKLLYGLGVIPDKIYYDIDALLKIKNFLNNESREYEFNDQQIVAPLKKLSVMQDVGTLVFEQPQAVSEMDGELRLLHMNRVQQMIRSSLALGIVEICSQIDIDSPFMS